LINKIKQISAKIPFSMFLIHCTYKTFVAKTLNILWLKLTETVKLILKNVYYKVSGVMSMVWRWLCLEHYNWIKF